MKAYKLGGQIAGQGFQLCSLLKQIPGEETFKIPETGTYYVPVNATTNWSMRRTGGTPAAALSVVDVTGDDAVRFKTNKVLQFASGVTGHSTNSVRYAFQAGQKPADFTGYNFLIWVKLEEGTGITAWSTINELDLLLIKDNSNFITYVLGVTNVEFASSGWYGFSCTTSRGGTVTGTVGLTEIAQIGLQLTKATTNAGIIQIGTIAIAPKPAKAQVLFMFDGMYESQKDVAALLTTNSMNATFYVDNESINFTLSEMLAIQANGHLFAAYARNWASNPIPILTAAQSFLTTNGLTGKRHFVHGITSQMTEALWTATIPPMADTCGYTMRTLTSQYHRKYNGRYNPSTEFDKAESIALVNAAVADGAKVGFLLHEVTGTAFTDLTDFVENTLKPLQDAGTIEVINVKQAWDKSKLF